MKSAWETKAGRKAAMTIFPAWREDSMSMIWKLTDELRSRALDWLESKCNEGVFAYWKLVRARSPKWRIYWSLGDGKPRGSAKNIDHALVQLVLAVAKLEREAKRA